MIQHKTEGGLFLRRVPATEGGSGTLLYIHGLGESGLCFEGVLQHPALASWEHRAPDLPGYGRTPWQGEILDVTAHADLLGERLKDQAGEPVVVIGHSMGGVIGLLLCERFPQQVRAFFNVEGNVSMGDCGFSSQVAAYSQADLLNHGFGEICEAIYRAGAEEPPLRDYYASMRHCDPRQLHQDSQDLVRLSREERLAYRQSVLEIPHRYLLGSPRGTGERSQELLRQAGVPFDTVAEAGHWPFLDQREAFVARLKHFLDGLDG